MRTIVFAVLFSLSASCQLIAQSVYTERPDDPLASCIEPGRAGIVGDGTADDTDAIQAAIDHVQQAHGRGLVFVAAGRYRLSHTLHLWSGIRIFGFGRQRPVFFLGANTPGYQEGHEFLGTGHYMLQFAADRPQPGEPVVDANEFTFYSGISNLDFEIGKGNPAAIAIRFHVAQHSSLAFMRISVGEGRAGLEDVGNNAHDLRIEGGEFGILTVRTSPAWQFLLMDSTLTGQRQAAIHTQEAGITLVRDHIAHTPVAVQVTQGMTEQLYARDLTLDDISGSAFVLGDVRKARHQVTLDHVLCHHVGQLIDTQDQIPELGRFHVPAQDFTEEHLALGLGIDPDGRERPGIMLAHKEILALPTSPVNTDLPQLPPMREWTNVHTLGVSGDGMRDDTAALQAAVEHHRVLYFPGGDYRLTGTLVLKPDSILIGLSPVTTRFVVLEREPAFAGPGPLVPLVLSARGGNATLSGIGLTTGDDNPRAAALVWRAGAQSLVDDVNFPRLRPRNASPTGNEDRFLDSQPPSLTVTEGGGGIFRGIWTANTVAGAGLLVENTDTRGVIYQLSCEHHMRHETQFHHVSGWDVYALQTEEEKPAGAQAFSVDLQDAHHLSFANLFMYRVSRNVMPKLNGVESHDSSEVFFKNVHNFSQTRLAFDNSVFDTDSGVRVRDHDFTSFALMSGTHQGAPLPLPPGVFAPGSKLEELATGFSNASGLTSNAAGQLVFTDAAMHRVYRWNAEASRADLLTAQVDSPMAAGFVSASSLLVLDGKRAVFDVAFPGGLTTPVTAAGVPKEGTDLLLPTGFHNSLETLNRLLEHRGVVYAPRSNMAIIADVVDQARDYFYGPGTRTAMVAGGNWQPLLQASEWRVVGLQEEQLAVSEDDEATFRLTLHSLQSLTAQEFVPRGGSSVVSDAAGNVYIAAGQLYVYNAMGKQLGVVELPERPGSLAFGASDHHTLFIGARSSLYALHTEAPGR